MTSMWALAALWLGLALIACLLSIWLRISTALSEIVVCTIAQLIIGAMIGSACSALTIKFLSGIGAIVLTFLAGTELDPAVFKLKWKEAATIGFASFLFPDADREHLTSGGRASPRLPHGASARRRRR